MGRGLAQVAADAAYQVFWPQAKTLMPGGFTPPEQIETMGSPQALGPVGRKPGYEVQKAELEKRLKG